MGFLQSYSLFLLQHPSKFLLGGIGSVISLFVITLLIRPFPPFKDPLIGFEARDTLISGRLNAWKLLVDETSASANNLSLTPNSMKYEAPYSSMSSPGRVVNELNINDSPNKLPEIPVVEMRSVQAGNGTIANEILDEGEDEYYRTVNSTTDSYPSLMHYSLDSSKAFCGKPYEGFAQVVIAPSTRYSTSGLFNLNSMIAICQLDRRLRLEQSIDDSLVFQRECERFQIKEDEKTTGSSTCCNSWSLPNYVACLNNKTTCMDIDFHDLKNTEQLINLCAPYFLQAPHEDCFNVRMEDRAALLNPGLFTNALSSESRVQDDWTPGYCGSIPDKCLKCNGWTFVVMNYLINESAFVPVTRASAVPKPRALKTDRYRGNNVTKEFALNRLSYTNIFLPMAKSSSLMKYYNTLYKYNLKTPFAQVKAMDFGLKNSLFEHLVSDDVKLFVIALVAILLVISIYTWSVILAPVILIIICLSLCLSYTIYELILNIPIFPFMNLLAVVISFGICSDNAMLFCKHWSLEDVLDLEVNRTNQKAYREQVNLERMLRRSTIGTLVATLATAISFLLSSISKVTAVKCFCFFATLTVLTNYLLILILLPPALILDSRLSEFASGYLMTLDKGPRFTRMLAYARGLRDGLLKLGLIIHKKLIFTIVTQYKFYLIISFLTILSCSSILVFYRPTLQPSDDDDIQLFSSKHAFEQYDKSLRKQFIFERTKLGESIASISNRYFDSVDTLPVRVVFGVMPDDGGNHLDPQDRGSLNFDHKFDLADPNVQIWILDFCHKLKQQRFIHPSATPDLSSCFLDTFKSWMEARSCKDPMHEDVDRSPCCQAYEFPYSRYTLDKCIGEALHIMRRTPQFNPNLNAGIRFFKNSTKVAALVIEYQSNRLYSESFTKMERFFNDINEWITWQINNTAPPSLKSGWFISINLELLALQTELEQSTISSILLEIIFATVALIAGTRDFFLTLAGTITIGTVIIVTVAALIVLKWSLGVAESILITLIIGLSIDFALHYCVAYSESKKVGTSNGIIHRILEAVGSPIALATITTTLAGFVIVWSEILAYQELGIFLMLIAFISWTTSTFFLLSILATVGSMVEHGELFTRMMFRRVFKILIDRM